MWPNHMADYTSSSGAHETLASCRRVLPEAQSHTACTHRTTRTFDPLERITNYLIQNRTPGATGPDGMTFSNSVPYIGLFAVELNEPILMAIGPKNPTLPIFLVNVELDFSFAPKFQPPRFSMGGSARPLVR
jgi:hypothetical protein